MPQASAAIEALADSGRLVLGLDIRDYQGAVLLSRCLGPPKQGPTWKERSSALPALRHGDVSCRGRDALTGKHRPCLGWCGP